MWKTAEICAKTNGFIYLRPVGRPRGSEPASRQHNPEQPTRGVPCMARSSTAKAKPFFRTTPSGAFDQYLQDIQKLPLIKDPAEGSRLARKFHRGAEKPADRRRRRIPPP